jgi:hypothetical protein
MLDDAHFSIDGFMKKGPVADWYQAQALREEPLRAGILDLNRYRNR